LAIHKSTLAVAIALATSMPAAAEPIEAEAVIVTHSNGQIAAKTREGSIAIAVTDTTEIREKKGLSRKTRDAKSLIPGLIIKVQGDEQGGTINASKIEFNERDWRSAVATKAGTVDEFTKNANQMNELRQAIIDGQEYVIQQETAVYFPTGKSTIAPEHKAELRALAEKAPSFGNYRISILGFADSRGDAAANERLSMKRADAVSNFLRQTGTVQPGRVLAPSAMGEGTTAPGETAPASDAEARRVVVRIVTPKTQLTK
jgi:OmpA-OmpF porin, OOP family